MVKKALLVGINYPGTSNQLNGCVNDIIRMNYMITNHFGFTENKNKRMLTDNSATTKNILRRLEWLVDGAKPGDVLLFHYSGHGSQMVDTDYDLDEEPDGLDEIICPIDLNWRDKVIKDDDFARIFANLPDGVNLTVVLDCCHSGTGLRGSLQNPYLPQSPNKDRVLAMPIDIENRAFDKQLQVKPRGIYTDRTVQTIEDQKGILLSGCRSDQTSADAWIQNVGKYMGAMTHFLTQTLKDNNYDLDYQTLITKTSQTLEFFGYSQRPELNCPSLMVTKKFLQPFI